MLLFSQIVTLLFILWISKRIYHCANLVFTSDYTDWKLPRKCTDYQLVKPRPYDCNISMQHIATLLSFETCPFNCDRFWPSAHKSMIKKGKQKSFCTLHKHLLSNFLLSWGLPTFQEAVQNVQKSKATPVC